MIKYTLAFIGVFLIVFSLLSASRIKPLKKEYVYQNTSTNWDKLGENTIEPSENGVSIVKANSSKAIKAIKIKVKKGGFNLHRCEIWFTDGSKKAIELRNNINEGTESRIIELKDNIKGIDQVQFWYDTRNFENSHSQVELWGL
ncbi:MAG: hypothetical protein ACO29O_09235 [Chitinophagaceae bacterium]